MGGVMQFGSFSTLTEAVEAWKGFCVLFVEELGLFLAYAEITFYTEEALYMLAMRFYK